MKNILLIILTIFSSLIYSQKNKNLHNCFIKDTISLKESYLGINKYTDELNKEGSVVFTENDTIENSISIYENEGLITNRIHNKKTNIVKTINYDLLSKKIISYSFYYKKGSFNLGKKYIYDQNGKVIKIIDNDEPEHYSLCYKDAEAIVLKKMGKKYEIENITRTTEIINNKKEYLWEIITTIKGSNKYSDKKRFYLDGKTGKILKVTKLQISSSDVLTPIKK